MQSEISLNNSYRLFKTTWINFRRRFGFLNIEVFFFSFTQHTLLPFNLSPHLLSLSLSLAPQDPRRSTSIRNAQRTHSLQSNDKPMVVVHFNAAEMHLYRLQWVEEEEEVEEGGMVGRVGRKSCHFFLLLSENKK